MTAFVLDDPISMSKLVFYEQIQEGTRVLSFIKNQKELKESQIFIQKVFFFFGSNNILISILS